MGHELHFCARFHPRFLWISVVMCSVTLSVLLMVMSVQDYFLQATKSTLVPKA